MSFRFACDVVPRTDAKGKWGMARSRKAEVYDGPVLDRTRHLSSTAKTQSSYLSPVAFGSSWSENVQAFGLQPTKRELERPVFSKNSQHTQLALSSSAFNPTSDNLAETAELSAPKTSIS
ncbi:hypothetical protein H4Q26_002735 [Puccinia striiformis f. sp. tritici PST-130]|nr:hypothetical protein H4Q26_002735 [Puccinia striiformis f. sp. tritici PST-130]